MTDLTKIDKPFGELDRETQLALFEAWLDEKIIETRFTTGEFFCVGHPEWLLDWDYRVRPEPLTPDTIDWSHVAPEYRWMARDQSGSAYLYDAEPHLTSKAGVWVNESCDIVRATAFTSYKRGTCDWRDSLVERPSE